MEETLSQSINRLIKELLSGPFILLMIIPVIFLDIFVIIFQWICFPLYKIPYVKRAEHFQYDRANLTYLNPLRKFHCLYCSYFHGVIDYTKEIAGCVERYWCPIKEKQARKTPHSHYDIFCEHNNEQDYKERAFQIGEFNKKSSK